MKVSIITVSYNSAKTIEDTIQSVFSQAYPNIEYIVIDGGSTDGTREIIKKYEGRIEKFISEKDGGIYDAMNKGIEVATGDIIGTLNSDDVYADERVIERVVSVMREKNSDVCWGDLVYVKADNLNKVVRNWKSSDYAEGKFKKGWHPPHPTFFVKKEVYKKFGLFNLDFKIAADYELMLRLLEKHKARGIYIPEVLVKMRIGGASNKSLRNIVRANIESYKAWRVNGLPIHWWHVIRKPLSKLKQYVS